jgi:NADH-quinone oxidoreductase subunit H
MFFLAEYVNMVIVSALATTLFLGGWLFPFVGADSPLNQGWLPVIWFFAKLFVLLFGFIWLRGTLPRLRYDQFMQLGWKVLVPLNLVWIVLIVSLRAIKNSGNWSPWQYVVGGGVLVLLIMGVMNLLPQKPVPNEDYVPITGGGYPLPPLDLRVPEATPRQKALAKAQARAAKRKPAAVGAGAGEPERTTKGSAQDGDV